MLLVMVNLVLCFIYLLVLAGKECRHTQWYVPHRFKLFHFWWGKQAHATHANRLQICKYYTLLLSYHFNWVVVPTTPTTKMTVAAMMMMRETKNGNTFDAKLTGGFKSVAAALDGIKMSLFLSLSLSGWVRHPTTQTSE